MLILLSELKGMTLMIHLNIKKDIIISFKTNGSGDFSNHLLLRFYFYNDYEVITVGQPGAAIYREIG